MGIARAGLERRAVDSGAVIIPRGNYEKLRASVGSRPSVAASPALEPPNQVIHSAPKGGRQPAISRGKLDLAVVRALLLPRYDPIVCSGAGASGEVWLVRDTKDAGKHWAAKIFYYPESTRELAGVGRTLPLRHEGIIQIVHQGQSEDGALIWYVMPRADDIHGGEMIFNGTYIACTLEEYLKGEPGGLPEGECLSIALGLCGALLYLSGEGFIHRDLKPANILRVGNQWKLGDIGLVAPIDSKSFVGTPAYMPPEGPGKPGADLYSLGIILYQMLSGDLHPELKRWLNAPERTAKTMRSRLLQVARKATEGQPGRRYKNAEAMCAALQKIQANRK